MPVRMLILLAALFLPALARADVTAIYKGDLGASSRVEIADNGDMRGEMDDGTELFVKDGAAYVVRERLTGPIVTRADDLLALWRAMAASLPRSDGYGPDLLVEQGTAVVEGRTGRAYYLRTSNGSLDKKPLLVIGDDPALRPLGPALARIARMDMERNAASDEEHFRDSAQLEAAMAPIIESGVPLRIGHLQLAWAETAPISPDRFRVPAEPETPDALRARLAAEKAEQDAREGPSDEAMIANAAFSAGRLWLLDASGRLSSLAEDESARRPEQPGAKVFALCANSTGPVIATRESENGRIWTLRRWRGQGWAADRTIRRARDVPVALACTEGRQLLLTSRRLITVSPGSVEEVSCPRSCGRLWSRRTSMPRRTISSGGSMPGNGAEA